MRPQARNHSNGKGTALGELGGLCGVGSAGGTCFRGVARLAARLCGVEFAGVSFVGANRVYVGAHGISWGDAPRERSFCAEVVDSGAAVVVPDAAADLEYAGHEEVVGQGVRSYAGVPVVVDGRAVGAVCVLSRKAREATEEELDLLRELAELVGAQIVSGRPEFRIFATEELGRLLSDGIEGFALINLDVQGRICTWNVGAERLYRRSANDVLGRTYYELFVEGATEEVAAGLRQACLHGRSAVEGWRRRGDGTAFWARGVVTAVRDGQGRVVGLAKVERDETELHLSQELSRDALRRADEANAGLVTRTHELEDARQRAEAAVLAKAAFLENVSHELRTPLTAIMGYVELLTDSESMPVEMRAELLESIRRNGSHLLALIGDIIDLSRLHGGEAAPHVERFSPRRLTEEVVDLLRHHAGGKGLMLRWRADEAVPAMVECDARRVRQVLLNLVGNAIKFTDHGSVDIEVHRTETDEPIPMPMLEFVVRDTGIGIAPGVLRGLFEPFTQVDQSSARRCGGAGLGLALCKRLTEMLGGSIRVTSEPGKGTSFVVGFRVHEIDAKAQPAAENVAGNTCTFAGLDARVLVVDDGPDNRRLIEHHLRKAGARIHTAVNGLECVEAVLRVKGTSEAYDLIVMDMQMPVMDGWTAARTLREAGISSPILALTANVTPEARERCLGAGCTAYVSKPVDRSTLMSVCSALVSGRTAA